MFVFQLDHLGDKGPVPVTAATAGILSEREATETGETHTVRVLLEDTGLEGRSC